MKSKFGSAALSISFITTTRATSKKTYKRIKMISFIINPKLEKYNQSHFNSLLLLYKCVEETWTYLCRFLSWVRTYMHAHSCYDIDTILQSILDIYHWLTMGSWLLDTRASDVYEIPVAQNGQLLFLTTSTNSDALCMYMTPSNMAFNGCNDRLNC